jgi:hypothetical protein
VDTKPDPTKATICKIIEPEEVFKKTGYSRPHTVHCGPEGIYVSTLGGGGKDGTDGPPGIFIMDCETFDILGRWEIDRGPQMGKGCGGRGAVRRRVGSRPIRSLDASNQELGGWESGGSTLIATNGGSALV